MFFRAYFGWSLKHVAQNYIFISISFCLFIAILRAKIFRVNKASIHLFRLYGGQFSQSVLRYF